MKAKSIFAAMLLIMAGVQMVGAQKGVPHRTNGQTIGHDWVDLGLPSGTLWATCNIGAKSPEDYGVQGHTIRPVRSKKIKVPLR